MEDPKAAEGGLLEEGTGGLADHPPALLLDTRLEQLLQLRREQRKEQGAVARAAGAATTAATTALGANSSRKKVFKGVWASDRFSRTVVIDLTYM